MRPLDDNDLDERRISLHRLVYNIDRFLVVEVEFHPDYRVTVDNIQETMIDIETLLRTKFEGVTSIGGETRLTPWLCRNWLIVERDKWTVVDTHLALVNA